MTDQGIYNIAVSIIVPIYKVENEISRCLLSIIQQGYDHIELILVNDCTPDDSFFIAKEIIEANNHNLSVIYVDHEHNMGLSCARNTGVGVASGEYLFFLDSDDELSSDDAISVLVKAALHYDSPEVIMAGHQRLNENQEVLENCVLQEMKYTSNHQIYEDYDRGNLGKNNFNDYAWGKLIKKDTFLKKDLYFERGIYYEDTLWGYYLYRRVSSVVTLTNTIVNYYEREGSITSNITKKHVEDFNKVIELMYIDFLNNPDYFPMQTQKEIERRRRESIDRMLLLPTWSQRWVIQEIGRLKKIRLSPTIQKFSYLKQNILFRLPKFFIYLIFLKKR